MGEKMRILSFIIMVGLALGGFLYPVFPQTGLNYWFAGVGSTVSVSKETKLAFTSSRAYGLAVNGNVIKDVFEERGQYFHMTLRPGQEVEILGSPMNQKVYVTNADVDREDSDKVISTRISNSGWAKEASSPFSIGAFLILLWALIFVMPVKKVDGTWLSLWLVIQFRLEDARVINDDDRYPDLTRAIGKLNHAMLYPLTVWVSIPISCLGFGLLCFVQMLVFGL